MSKVEEYVTKTNEANSIIVDGKYFNSLKEKMFAKFSRQPNPEERVRKLEDNAKEIFFKIRNLEIGNGRNLLLVGKVQSGKTSNMQMALSLAFDNGYNLMVLYGGYDNTLLDQAINRFKEAFKKPDNMSDDEARLKWVNIFTTRPGMCYPLNALDNETVEEIIDNGGKIIIICLKSPDNIDKVNEVLEELSLDKIKSVIFDDEGDQASLNNEFRKGGQSPTYEKICEMKRILNYPPYLSVTATPQALVFSPVTSELRPRMLQLIYPGQGYTGLSDFHLNDDRVLDVDDDIDLCLEKNPPKLSPSLWCSLYTYFITSAILLKRRILDKTQMIVHFDKLTKKHELIYNLIRKYVNSIQENIRNNQTSTLNNKLAKMEFIFNDSRIIGEGVKGDLKFEDIRGELITVLRKVHPALMNGKGKDTMAGLEWKKWQIRIGADLLQRGVSFDELVTTYFTRWPKGKSNMDTQIQRARWLGYRTKYFDYCHVFTTSSIEYMFSRLAEIEDDLWTQMLEVEDKNKTLDDIIVDADPKLRPSRRSAADYSVKTFGRRWFNQSIALSNNELIVSNNNVLLNLINKYEFSPITAGSTELDPTRVTGYKARISFKEFSELILKTNGIFANEPFGSCEKLLRIAEEYQIDMVLFWDKNKIDLTIADKEKIKDDIRTRGFKVVGNDIRVSALQQGADKTDEKLRKYNGDAKVYVDEKTITVQVFPILPIVDKSPDIMRGKFQFMYSIRVPKAVSVYTKGDN